MNNKAYLRLNEICDKIFLNDLAGCICEPFNQKWLKSSSEDFRKYIDYNLKVRGVSVQVRVAEIADLKAEAYLFIGNYRTDGNAYFSKKIKFSIFKRGNILNEFINRLGIKLINEKVELILDKRAKMNAYEEELQLKKDVFRKYLDFQDYGYNDLIAYCGENKVKVQGISWDKPVLEISANVDDLMRICAYASEVLASKN